MSVENGYGSRKNDVRNRHGLIGPWTVVRNGFPEQVEINSVEDLMKHRIRVTSYSVGDTFGPEAKQVFSRWLGERQPKNGR